MTVGEYCQAMERNEIVVNREYQRSDRIWPSIARSYLIESLILGYPLPKFTHYLVTDVKSKTTQREIVDGQQRSMAVRDFYQDKFRLVPSLETGSLKNKRYSELDGEHQGAFLTATLSIDQLVAAPREEVREAFRRMNSYTIPLNPEEHRHAVFQGPFKWFIHRVAQRFNKTLVDIGLFSEKQMIRMADTKLLAEIYDANVFGIRTTNKRILDQLYKKSDKEFPEENRADNMLTEAIDIIADWEDIHNGNLMKPYIVYSLLLAIIHMRRPIEALQELYQSPEIAEIDFARASERLSDLSEALEAQEEEGRLGEFVRACTSRTNVKDQRETRFRVLCDALVSEAW